MLWINILVAVLVNHKQVNFQVDASVGVQRDTGLFRRKWGGLYLETRYTMIRGLLNNSFVNNQENNDIFGSE